MKYDIYPVYSRKDEEVVRRILNSLTKKGYKVIHKESILYTGEDFALKITNFITQSRVILFFLSEDSAKESTWVRREIEYAIQNNKKVLPILLSDDIQTDGWYSFSLNRFEAISYHPAFYSHFIEDLVLRLNHLGIVRPDSDQSLYHEIRSAPRRESSPIKCPNTDEGRLWEKSQRSIKWPKVVLAILATAVVVFLIIGILYLYSSSMSRSMSPDESRGKSEQFEEKIDSIIVEQIPTVSDTVVEQQTANNSQGVQDSISVIGVPQDVIVPEGVESRQESVTKSRFLLLYFILTFLAGFALKALLSGKKKKPEYNIKLSSNIASKVSVDGALLTEIVPREVYPTSLETGEYLIDFEDINDKKRHQTYNQKVSANECKLLYACFKDKEPQNIKTIKCFIAGSTNLQRERDALRAVTCVMYNKWMTKDFRILSYTFEDFDRASVIEGHQNQYNEFIVNEADWALFVIDGALGGITKEEYQIAMSAYKKNGKPRILALAKAGSDRTEEVAELLKEIKQENQYWSVYDDIKELKHIFESTLNWDLISIYH